MRVNVYSPTVDTEAMFRGAYVFHTIPVLVEQLTSETAIVVNPAVFIGPRGYLPSRKT